MLCQLWLKHFQLVLNGFDNYDMTTGFARCSPDVYPCNVIDYMSSERSED
uniref:Uncharacterized protein n=1 Tax=Rhizophora mucronata TaxID=61149 RepID=A0A2P2NGD7_RHIMU